MMILKPPDRAEKCRVRCNMLICQFFYEASLAIRDHCRAVLGGLFAVSQMKMVYLRGADGSATMPITTSTRWRTHRT